MVETGKVEVLNLIKKLREENENLKKKQSFKWYLSPIISIVVIIAGLLINWGVMTASIEYLEKTADSNATRIADNYLETMRLDKEVVAIRTKSNILLEQMTADVAEITEEVKKMNKRRK